MATYNHERGIVILIFGVDIDAGRDEFLAAFQVAPPAGLQKVLEIRGHIQGVLVAEYPCADELVVVLELGLKLEFADRHGGFPVREFEGKKVNEEKIRIKINYMTEWKV
jgi:hypothetical protein